VSSGVVKAGFAAATVGISWQDELSLEEVDPQKGF